MGCLQGEEHAVHVLESYSIRPNHCWMGCVQGGEHALNVLQCCSIQPTNWWMGCLQGAVHAVHIPESFSIQQPIGEWDVSKVKNKLGMFSDCPIDGVNEPDRERQIN